MLQSGSTQMHVARAFDVHRTQISRLWTRYRETGSIKDRPRSGRPKVTTLRQDRHIRLQHLRNRFLQATETARTTVGTHGRPVNEHTIRRRLKDADLTSRRPVQAPILSELNRANRLQWTRTRQRWSLQQWGRVLFSDESRFCCSVADGRQRIWRRKGERYAQVCIQQYNRWGGPNVMVWAGITAEHRTDLVVLQGNMTARRYMDEILGPHVIPFMEAHPEIRLLQQDNARPHAAAATQEFLAENDVAVLPWPPYSPDFNPIEHLWDIIGRRTMARNPASRNTLIQFLQEEWRAIPQEQIRKLIRSMRSRCNECVEADGGHTHY